jgi:hypothetical protein
MSVHLLTSPTSVSDALAMCKIFISLVLGVLLVALGGCGTVPGISENRKNFAPWDKLPQGDGITYLAKYELDPGIDPIYLAKIQYSDDVALQKVLDTFGLVSHEASTPPDSFVSVLKNPPAWYPLQKVTQIFAYPQSSSVDYVANLWVNADEHTAILERSWW